MRLAWVLAAVLLACLPGVASAADPPDPGQTTSGSFSFDGDAYPYLLYTPSSYRPGNQGLNVGSTPTSDSQAPNAAEVKADLKADQAQLAAETTATAKPGEDPAIARAREELAAAAAKLDLLKRANALDQDTYFSKPNYTTDHDGKAKLDAEQAEINDQQSIVDDLKAKLEQLKAEHGVVDAEPAKKKPSKPQNAGFTMPDKTGDQPASDQQPAAQPQS